MQDGGNYEVIRKRLVAAARALQDGARDLDSQRRDAFGGTEIAIAGNTRVRTDNNCVPMDIVNVGGHLIFAYNVTLGLRKETRVADVLSLHAWEDGPESLNFVELGRDAHGGFLQDPRFVKDFQEIYTYYDSARLLTLRRVQEKLLAVFQVGRTLDDVKVLRFTVDPEGDVTYVDNRGEPDHVFPPSHDFEWTRPTSADHILGRHPHISILDEVFVETVGGDLTIKIEDNTEDGQGIYREDVDDPNQSLDDADIAYARRGNLILLSIKPYGEEQTRYLVFNTQTRAVSRVDGIGQSCQTLPEDHGILFPGGYLLRTGELKIFDPDARDMVFERVIRSPNGEDVLYVFHRHSDGLYLLCPYNLIQKEVVNPLTAHGWSLFRDGTLVVFKADDKATRVHPLQIWNTPFVSDEFHAAQPEGEGLLARIGNRDLVRGISDAYTLVNLATREEVTRQVYEELVVAANRFNDAYYWAGEEGVGDLRHKVIDLRDTAELIIDEFEKVQVLKRRAAEVLRDAKQTQHALVSDLRPDSWSEVQPFLEAMTALRRQRGHLITLREVKYVDLEALDTLEEEVVEAFERISKGAVEFLLGDGALAPLLKEIEALDTDIAEVTRTKDLADLEERLETTASGVDLLSEVVAALEVDDPTQKAAILGDIGEVYAQVNRVRATLSGRKEDLAGAEATAEFAARFQLLGQAVQNGLGLAKTPEAADDQLSALLLQLEELEASFGEYDRFLPQLTEKRQEITEAFAAKKQALVDARNRRVQTVQGSATRILEGIARRARTFEEQDELNAWFASDPMVLKLRQLADQLGELGDTVKQDELLARLKSAKQDALRALRDKQELFADGTDLITLGKHQFTVNTQPLDLTVVPRDEGLALHLTGTDLYLDVEDPEFLQTRPFWGQTVVSETREVYRAEYLAASILRRAEAETGLGPLHELAAREEELLAFVREQAINRYEEGYERGIHDADATKILDALLTLRQNAGLLRHAPTPRALAMLFWAFSADDAPSLASALSPTPPDTSRPDAAWQARARSLARLRAALGPTPAIRRFAVELQDRIHDFLHDSGLHDASNLGREHAAAAGAFLFEILARDTVQFPVSADASTLKTALERALQDHGGRTTFDDELRALDGRLNDQLGLAHAWVEALAATSPDEAVRAAAGSTFEAAAALLAEHVVDVQTSHVQTAATVEGLLGRHPRITEGRLEIRLEQFEARLDRFMDERVPGFKAYREARTEMLERERERLRVDEYMPKVMSAFVRNKLINDVYLHLIGDNLAKQMGAAGAGKRTDLMGMLLLISPPGYGKTTLMEYVANRLGLVFMKVNGPALGHSVTSLDPGEAPNATARQEVQKINLAFEMGNNVMLYLDDIQHTHPELLQKFISLCDAQRRIEGVWDGKTRTYDLRGKKFCVVMAGNPYTESGEAFQIPDMLANRADTYNLGDILSGREEAFALSFIENSLTSNPTLAPLSGRSQKDVYKLVDMARGVEVPSSELEHDYSAVELQEITTVLSHLMKAQQTLLKVNAEYIRSASMDDTSRTEPRFQLQGSYRNMNKLAEKIVSAMTADEIEALIVDHYQGEAQTLTTGAEANLLKLGELRGTLTPEQQERWAQIKDDFRRTQLMGSGDDDPVTRVTGVLSGVVQQLTGIGRALQADDTPWPDRLSGLEQQLQGVQYGLGDLVKAVQADDGEEEARAMVKALTSVRDAITERPDPTVDLESVSKPLVYIARHLRDHGQSGGTDPALAAVLQELQALRQAPAAAPQVVVQGTGGGPPTQRQAMGAALGVIQELAMQIAGLAQTHLPEEGYHQFMDELRRTVAGSVVGVAETTRGEESREG